MQQVSVGFQTANVSCHGFMPHQALTLLPLPAACAGAGLQYAAVSGSAAADFTYQQGWGPVDHQYSRQQQQGESVEADHLTHHQWLAGHHVSYIESAVVRGCKSIATDY
jgi:hypothetical protein